MLDYVIVVSPSVWKHRDAHGGNIISISDIGYSIYYIVCSPNLSCPSLSLQINLKWKVPHQLK